MSALRELHPLDAGNLREEGPIAHVVRFIVLAIDDEGGGSDVVELVDDRPGSEGSCDVKLRRPNPERKIRYTTSLGHLTRPTYMVLYTVGSSNMFPNDLSSNSGQGTSGQTCLL